MNDMTRFTVFFACNNPDGTFTGRVRNITVLDLIELEGPCGQDGIIATTAFRRNEGSLTLDGAKSFGHVGHTRHFVSLYWDSFEMKPGAVLRLLNYLKSTGMWDCTEAHAGLGERWRTADRLVMDDLRREAEA